MPSQSSSPSPEKGVALNPDRLKLALDAFYGDDAYSTTLDGIRAAIIAWEASKPAVEKAAPDLLNALQYYADPETYAPHPHGIGFDRRDKSYVAIAAIARAEGK